MYISSVGVQLIWSLVCASYQKLFCLNLDCESRQDGNFKFILSINLWVTHVYLHQYEYVCLHVSKFHFFICVGSYMTMKVRVKLVNCIQAMAYAMQAS